MRLVYSATAALVAVFASTDVISTDDNANAHLASDVSFVTRVADDEVNYADPKRLLRQPDGDDDGDSTLPQDREERALGLAEPYNIFADAYILGEKHLQSFFRKNKKWDEYQAGINAFKTDMEAIDDEFLAAKNYAEDESRIREAWAKFDSRREGVIMKMKDTVEKAFPVGKKKEVKELKNRLDRFSKEMRNVNYDSYKKLVLES